MITRSHRFHGYNSLSFVYRHGQTIHGPLSSLKYIKNKRRKSYRLAVVVNKKVNKSAVVRNRIRRRIYETVRNEESKINEPYDLVITVFNDHVANMGVEEIENMIISQFKESGVTKNN